MEEVLRTGHVGTAKGRDHPVVRTWPFNYSREWLANAGGSPIRQHWIDRWRELGALDGLQAAGRLLFDLVAIPPQKVPQFLR